MTATERIKEVLVVKVEDPNSHLPVKTLQNSTKTLSSVLDNRRPLSGLTPEEERILLPKVIGIQPDSRDFEQKALEYWKDLSVKIDGDGYQLRFPVTDDVDSIPGNMVEDYIIYKWLKKHPLVADTKERAVANPKNNWAYIYDPEIEEKKDADTAITRVKAYSELRKLMEDEELMNHVIRILTNNRPEYLSKEKKFSILDQQAETNSKEFLRVVKDKDLKTRAEILEMVEKEVVRKIGNQFLFIDETIGNTVEEVIAYFNNKKNSEQVATMRAKLKEARIS